MFPYPPRPRVERQRYLLPNTVATPASIGGTAGFNLTQTELTNVSANVNQITVGEDGAVTPNVTAGAVTIGASSAVNIGSRNLTLSGTDITLTLLRAPGETPLQPLETSRSSLPVA